MGNELKIKVEQDNTKEIADKQEREWEVERAIDTLIRAEEIKKDKELMALVEPKLREKAQAAQNAAEILYGKKEGE
jgi:hypothetical protein